MSDNFSLRQSLIDCCKRLYDRNLVGGNQGNVSARIDSGRLIITPAGSNLGRIRPDDLIVLSQSGRKLSGTGQPSSEYRLHLGIYNSRRDVQAVCHAHPMAVTACAICDLDMNLPILPEISANLGRICSVEYETPGTPRLFEKMAPYVMESDTFILKNHGAVALGETLEAAFTKMEILERYARILIYANQLGPIRQIPAERLREIPGCRELEEQLKIR